MSSHSISRRHFMQGSSAMAGSSLLRLSAPVLAAAAQAACSARDEGAAYKVLSATEALELEAMAARILPTTTTPGAREAGVIHFFDNVLGGPMAGMLGAIRGSLPGFQQGVTDRFAGAERFSDLGEDDQDAWLAENERTPLFNLVRTLTLIGFFAMSKHGGNKDHLSWDLIGFEGHAATQPPFGYYDAQYIEENPNGD